ncbi:ribokinase [Microbacteriaceae bacterium VKM Ac-2854]|nr:ribokinase [Microbacteriaceae bacterium VKM Ac-2854]
MTVVVLGSANLDLVYRVERIPKPGETLLATAAEQHPGGKGNNQVIAAARAGADATFIAAIGSDAAGDTLTATLAEAGVRMLVRRVTERTGTALITVDSAAENTIVVDSGANATLLDLSGQERDAIAGADALLLQLETPLPTVLDAARTARAAGTLTALNAAPIQPLPDELLAELDLLIVNEHEAAVLADGDPADPDALAATLLERVPALIITLGSAGALIATREGSERIAGLTVDAVDTTGAGDTFCGALVAVLTGTALAALVEASRFATAAAALSVQYPGAVPSIPHESAIRALL